MELGYSLTDDIVTLRMTMDDYHCLLFMLGSLTGEKYPEPEIFWRDIELVNRINANNTEFNQYTTPPGIPMPDLYAWMGQDELGSGQVGIKQGACPAGFIPLVAVDRDKHKLLKLKLQMEEQARYFGKRISLVRYHVLSISDFTEAGADESATQS